MEPLVNNTYKRTVSTGLLVGLFLFMLKGFNLSILPMTTDYLMIFALPFMGNLTKFWHEKTPYNKPIIYYCLFLSISFVYSFIMHKQSPIYTVVHSFWYYGPLAYFVLLKYKPSYAQIERALLILCIIYCVCYLVQYLIYPTIIFSSAESNVNDEKFRMRLTGSLFTYILYFMGANKYIQTKNTKYLGYIILGFLPMLIMGFRSLMLVSIVAVFAMIPFVVHSTKRTIVTSILCAGLVLGALQTDIVKYKINEMMERQEKGATLDNEDYIRYRSLDFYWNYLDAPGEKIIGAGLPTDVKSTYKRDISSAIEYWGYYWVDLGLVGLSFMIGLPAVLLLVFMYSYSIWIARAPDIQFIRFCLAVVFIGSIFTSMELYRPGNLIIVPILFYMVYKHNEENKPIVS